MPFGIDDIAIIIGLVETGVAIANLVLSQVQAYKHNPTAIESLIKKYNSLYVLLNIVKKDEDQFKVQEVEELGKVLPVLKSEFTEDISLLSTLLTRSRAIQFFKAKLVKDNIKSLNASLDSCEQSLQSVVAILHLKTSQNQGRAAASQLSMGLDNVAHKVTSESEELALKLKEESNKLQKSLEDLETREAHQFEIVIKMLEELGQDKLINIKPEELDRRIKTLGGTSTQVYATKYYSEEVAVKELRIEPKPSDKQIKLFKKEVRSISKIRSKYIVQYFGACIQEKSLSFVMELMDGDLFKLLHVETGVQLNPSTKIRMALDITRGLLVLHSHKIIHRNICSKNILYNQHYRCKLTDFGVTKYTSEGQSSQPHQHGDKAYWSPQIRDAVIDDMYSLESDIFALGILLWELTTRQDPNKIPYQEGNTDIDKQAFAGMNELICKCLDDNPLQRYTAQEVVDNLSKNEIK